jgi:hypothetical protein
MQWLTTTYSTGNRMNHETIEDSNPLLSRTRSVSSTNMGSEWAATNIVSLEPKHLSPSAWGDTPDISSKPGLTEKRSSSHGDTKANSVSLKTQNPGRSCSANMSAPICGASLGDDMTDRHHNAVLSPRLRRDYSPLSIFQPSVSQHSSPMSSSFQQPDDAFATDVSCGDSASEITDYSERTLAGSEELQEENSGLLTILSTFGLAVARRVLYQVRSLLDGKIIFNTFPTGAGEPGMSSSSHSATSQSSGSKVSSMGPGNNKRTREKDESNRPNGDDPGDDPNKRRQLTGVYSLPPLVDRKFACPFFKRHPDKHRKWRSCSGPGWDTIHRLKYVF